MPWVIPVPIESCFPSPCRHWVIWAQMSIKQCIYHKGENCLNKFGFIVLSGAYIEFVIYRLGINITSLHFVCFPPNSYKGHIIYLCKERKNTQGYQYMHLPFFYFALGFSDTCTTLLKRTEATFQFNLINMKWINMYSTPLFKHER